MADQEEDDLRTALRMSMQNSPPEPKRSKPRDAGAPVASPEDLRRMKRELMAAAAEKRLLETRVDSPSPSQSLSPSKATVDRSPGKSTDFVRKEVDFGLKEGSSGKELSSEEANELFSMVFGSGVSNDILAQWSNQGIRFSPDPETSMGLVQHEGGPCGVLATIQAFVLKHLLFFPNEIGKVTSNVPQNLGSGGLSKSQYVASDNFSSLTEDAKARALVKSMGEILFMCGDNKRAVIATLNAVGLDTEGFAKNEIIAKALEGLTIESASDLQKILRIDTYTSQTTALQKLHTALPVFQSRMGALLFLISALLSRGLDSIQADRDDPNLPLVTAPFGHASQEIVNLLLCGQAVPNVFDGRMDFGGGMFLKGISMSVEVGFLTLLESLNFCKVGQHLKCPKWPIWVVGSESHYTVLFALDTSVQDENELEERESQIRRAFDAQDQSGGGGFISVEGFHQVLREVGIRLPSEKLDHLCSTGFIVWSEFWQVILDLDKSLGGLKDSSGLMGKKVFDLCHFNGIAKSDINGSPPPIPSPSHSLCKMIHGEKAKDVVVLNDDPYFESEIDKIRGRWELASILNFLSIFEPVLGVDLKLTAEEIESGLVKPNKSLAQLHVKLLKGIPPVSNKLKASDAWVTALCKKLATWWPWVAEGELPLKEAKGEEISEYKELDPTNRLLILKALCEIRAEQDDIASYVNTSLKDGTEISYFRKDKVGGDGTAISYWYDGSSTIGHRLYKEVNMTRANIRMKGKASKNLPATCLQWEILATNLEGFQKVVNELSSSKVVADVAAGKTIETDVLPIIQKFQKKKDRALKQKERQEELLNSFRSYTAGITRSCRSRRPISYTFDDYDRAIDEAIKITKKRNTIEEESNDRKHVKQGIASDGGSNMGINSTESLGEKGDSDMSADSKGNIEKGNFSDSEESGKLDEAGNDDDDSDDDYDDKMDYDNGNRSGKSDEENETFGGKNIARKFGSRWSSRLAGVASHPVVEAGNFGTKNRLRQRPMRNSALDSINVLDSDDETSSKHTNSEISGHEDLSPVCNSEGVSDSL